MGWLDSANYYTAFTEGWGLYAENPLIAEDTDTYMKEPMQEFGMLQWQVKTKKGTRFLALYKFTGNLKKQNSRQSNSKIEDK